MFILCDGCDGAYFKGSTLEVVCKLYEDYYGRNPNFSDVTVFEGKEVKVNVKTTYSVIQDKPVSVAKKPATKSVAK